MIPARFRTIWDTRTFSTPCATRRWRRTDLKPSGRIKCSAGSGGGSELLRKPKCKNHRNNAYKVTGPSSLRAASLPKFVKGIMTWFAMIGTLQRPQLGGGGFGICLTKILLAGRRVHGSLQRRI